LYKFVFIIKLKHRLNIRMNEQTEKEITDEEIVSLVQKGDKEKFGVIVDRYEKKLFRYATKFISDTYKIEDLVQDIFIKVYENIMGFDTTRRFSPWIYRIAHNVFINDIKKKKNILFNTFDFDELLPHREYGNTIQEEIIGNETKELLENGLKNLSEKYKEVLILHYIEDLSYKEIAEILKVPIGTVGIRLKRAKNRLTKQIPSDILNK